ncbi:MAG: hypothetical protein KAT48_14110 [Bacteroidales bacterium]|nr:hypothetical protein [Bacteroidales bacterium]
MWLSISVAIDYISSLWFAGNKEYLIENEHSVIFAYVMEYGIFIPYLIFIMAVYFMGSYIALGALSGHRLFPVACVSVVLVAISHTFGGLSWYFRNDMYSGIIIIIPQIAIILMILCLVVVIMDSSASDDSKI